MGRAAGPRCPVVPAHGGPVRCSSQPIPCVSGRSSHGAAALSDGERRQHSATQSHSRWWRKHDPFPHAVHLLPLDRPPPALRATHGRLRPVVAGSTCCPDSRRSGRPKTQTAFLAALSTRIIAADVACCEGSLLALCGLVRRLHVWSDETADKSYGCADQPCNSEIDWHRDREDHLVHDSAVGALHSSPFSGLHPQTRPALGDVRAPEFRHARTHWSACVSSTTFSVTTWPPLRLRRGALGATPAAGRTSAPGSLSASWTGAVYCWPWSIHPAAGPTPRARVLANCACS